MVKPQKSVILQFLLLFSIATVGSRPTTIRRRSLSPNCDPIFGVCSDQWPFLRRQIPPVVLPPPADSDPSFSPLVTSPPPPRYTLPPPSDSDPSFSPLVASPPPPHPFIPDLSPFDHDISTAPPLVASSFSPPAVADELPPEISLPPPAQDSMQPEPFNVPAPPLVPIVSQP
ncbi:extensin-like [Cynara cardunculus var. scolymus]|uniref:extensin-like n=1 Tax=Cynara cardunculus var. scolymus TaxID=59895 RepID=UPI000D625D17|nr:extensin-like [Cynara cardunculus var. scolymus]